MSEGDLSALDRVTPAQWSELCQRRTFFGHQSVGYNIIEGVEEILRERPAIALAVREDGDPAALAQPGLTHAKIGSNADAISKVQAFTNFMRAGAGARADAALFKLCYVDIEERTDPGIVFDRYVAAMDALAAEFPRVRLLHCTVPLTAIPGGVKNGIKRAIGRPVWGYEQNRRRGQFNARMRERYAASGRLFDIARVEATRPDGSVEGFDWQGARHEALVAGYSNDGGHLGPAGRRVLAREFLLLLARTEP